ncbi:MAG: hypothetical protein JKY65_02490, partial [Planctomycetes bacterium]|nr:hypothetical protein [Planctomycetota bacterium]
MVDAIEQHFVPVVVRNNVEGREREVLEQFGEPTWANPSARVVDPANQTTLVRIRGNYSRSGFLQTAGAGLRASKREVPSWLALHLGSGRRATATYSMACFWTGEARLGALEGVLSTRTGWRGGSEVVEVEFDPERVSEQALSEAAKRMRCAQPFDANAGFRATPKDDKYQVRRSLIRFLPLSATQATRINARLGRDFEDLLSPRQRRLWAQIQANPKGAWPLALGQPLGAAFAAAQR